MLVTSLIKNTANVTRIANLSEGDIYKRIKERSEGYGGDAKIYYGRVSSISSTENAAVIEVLEFESDWSGSKAVRRIFSSGEDLHIIPCSFDEFESEWVSNYTKIDNNYKRQLAALNDDIEIANLMNRLIMNRRNESLNKQIGFDESNVIESS